MAGVRPQSAFRRCGATRGVRYLMPDEDFRLTKITQLCRTLPETERALRGDHADFRVRQRVFAYFLNDHHGDGVISVCCKSALGENLERVRSDPARFYLPAYIGARGWFGMRLDREPIDWHEVENILERSYRLIAPKRLAQTLIQRNR
ncbi:MAG TPA: MmcQ/YjbR family DNA-binding protein [Steroidobacteraceae bacterium]|jgi:predicted DNA-binding protein (MmcQ/YjbR family)